MKFSKWMGIGVCLLLIGVCFMPWTYHADLQKNFTGFFSQNDTYGKPGKFIIFFCTISIVLFLVEKIWAKRTQLFISALMIAYTIKTYILYSSCYNAYCPDKKLGIYLVLILPVLIFSLALFPGIPLRNETDKA